MFGLKVVFMGTPDFSVPSLRELVREHHRVVGVYTQPDRPKGRGNKLTPSPVKVAAQEMGKKIIAIQPWGAERTSIVVKHAADTIVGWNTASIVRSIKE